MSGLISKNTPAACVVGGKNVGIQAGANSFGTSVVVEIGSRFTDQVEITFVGSSSELRELAAQLIGHCEIAEKAYANCSGFSA